MKQRPVVRKYKMSDGTLIQKADLQDNNMTRDAADFALRGVDADRQALLATARDNMSDCSSDEELQGEITALVEVKNGYRGELENQLRQMRSMADIQFKGKGYYTKFAFEDMTKVNDDAFIRKARKIHKVATDFLDDLSNQGLTTAKLGAFKALLDQFDEQVDHVHDAIENRDLETQKRAQYGNELYDYLIEFAKIGKSIYADTNEAKYNDYVILDEADKEEEPVVPAP